jgi:hypothetical protein
VSDEGAKLRPACASDRLPGASTCVDAIRPGNVIERLVRVSDEVLAAAIALLAQGA